MEAGEGLHQLHPVGLLGQALVDLEEGNDLLHRPEIVGRAPALDVTIHGPLEEDGPEDAIAVEAGAGHDAGPHLVDEVEHLLVVRPRVLRDPVELERLGRAAAALVERGDEPLARPHLLELLLVHGAAP